MGRWRDTEDDGGGRIQSQTYHSPPLSILFLVSHKDVITRSKYLYCKWAQLTFVEFFKILGLPWWQASLVAQRLKCLSTMRETRVLSLCWEDPLEKEMKWQSTPVLLPGKSHGQRSLVGYSPWGCKESDMTERLQSLTHSPT